MTRLQFKQVEQSTGAFVALLQQDAQQAGRRLPFWRYTILNNRLFESLLEDAAISSIGRNPDERAVAVALVLLGRSVAELRGGVCQNPLESSPPSPRLIADLARLVEQHRHPLSAWCRSHQVVVAALLGWGHIKLPGRHGAWRTTGRQLMEFLAHATCRARVNWLRQLDDHLNDFNKHPLLVGKSRKSIGIERLVRRMVGMLLDAPPCDHWRRHDPTLDPATLPKVIEDKTAEIEGKIRVAERAIASAREASDGAAAQEAEKSLQALLRKKSRGDFLENYARAFLACRRWHNLQGWNPVTDCPPVLEPPPEGTPPPDEREMVADLWGFAVRAFSGVASWIDYVMSAADTSKTDVLNTNRIFRHWEAFAQPFSSSLFFHTLNSGKEVLQWVNVVHWQCAESPCHRWKSESCPRPPSPLVRCGFRPGPQRMAALFFKYVRCDAIGVKGHPYARLKVWLCHSTHDAFSPVLRPRPDDALELVEKKIQVVYPFKLARCPWCNRAHSSRPAQVLVASSHLKHIQ